MAKGAHSDLFMVFYDADNIQILGQSTTDLTSSDRISRNLLNGFTPGKVFEIESFSMSADADIQTDAELRQSVIKENKAALKKPKAVKGEPTTPTKPVKEMSPAEITQEVNRRKQAQNGPPVKAITFKRAVDMSSKAFLGNLIVGKGYRSASLIKRKATGGKNAAQKALAADVYLRIDFDLVLVTKIDWEDDEGEVTEDTEFICRKITIKYRPQLPDGTLGAIVEGVWEWKPPS